MDRGEPAMEAAIALISRPRAMISDPCSDCNRALTGWNAVPERERTGTALFSTARQENSGK